MKNFLLASCVISLLTSYSYAGAPSYMKVVCKSQSVNMELRAVVSFADGFYFDDEDSKVNGLAARVISEAQSKRLRNRHDNSPNLFTAQTADQNLKVGVVSNHRALDMDKGVEVRMYVSSNGQAEVLENGHCRLELE